MAEERVQRRLAAILAADVVGYSRLMGADEAGTRARFNDQLDEVVRPAIDEHQGRLVKTIGDGFLVEFSSVVDALQCAVDIQNCVAVRQNHEPDDNKILLRIGIHLGDVIVEGEDIHGDGVNIAARLEGLAETGGICVSAMVYEGVRGKLEVDFSDIGDQSLKNIAAPVRVYRVQLSAIEGEYVAGISSDALFRRPAVAVLPFENLSGDSEQEYFVDGLTEDIITALSLWRSFPVIARNSTFAYKGQSPDVRKVGDELGARYVVEGSVRKAGDRVRVTAQLINAETGHHVWAERFDRNLEDIFSVQDEITNGIAAIIAPELERAEQRRLATDARPINLKVWELLQRAISLIYAFNADDNARAQEFLRQAIEIDPNYSQAYGWLSFSLMRDHWLGFKKDRERILAEMVDAGRKSVELDESDAQAHASFSLALLWAGRLSPALEEVETAIRLNPNNAIAYATKGLILCSTGRADEAIQNSRRAQQLNPIDPRNTVYNVHIAMSYLIGGDYYSAIEWIERAVERNTKFAEVHFFRAVALGHLNKSEDALKALHECEALSPGFVSQFHASRPYLDSTVVNGFLDGLRKAGWEG